MAKSVLLDTLSVAVRGAESDVAVATRNGAAAFGARNRRQTPSAP
jgi:2-methylcitrate dehydratase PrpD